MNKGLLLSTIFGAVLLQGCSVKTSESSRTNFQKKFSVVNGQVVEDTEYASSSRVATQNINGVTSVDQGISANFSTGVALKNRRGDSYNTYLNESYKTDQSYNKVFSEKMGELKDHPSPDDALTALENLTTTQLFPNFYFGMRSGLFTPITKNALKPLDFLKLDKSKYKSEVGEQKNIVWYDFIESALSIDEEKVASGVSVSVDNNQEEGDIFLTLIRTEEFVVVPVDLTMAQGMHKEFLHALKHTLRKVPPYDLTNRSFVVVEEPTELTDTISTAQYRRAPGAHPRVEEIDFRFNLQGDTEDMAHTHGLTGSGMIRLNNYQLGVAHSYANEGIGFKKGLQTETSAVAVAIFGKAFVELQSGVVAAENIHKANWNGSRHLVTIGYDFANSITPFVQLSSYHVKNDRIDQLTNPNGNKLYAGITVDAKSKEYALSKWSTLFTTKAGMQNQKAIYSVDLKQKFTSQDGVSISGAFKFSNRQNSLVRFSIGWNN